MGNQLATQDRPLGLTFICFVRLSEGSSTGSPGAESGRLRLHLLFAPIGYPHHRLTSIVSEIDFAGNSPRIQNSQSPRRRLSAARGWPGAARYYQQRGFLPQLDAQSQKEKKNTIRNVVEQPRRDSTASPSDIQRSECVGANWAVGSHRNGNFARSAAADRASLGSAVTAAGVLRAALPLPRVTDSWS